jgi:hypothetical protein
MPRSVESFWMGTRCRAICAVVLVALTPCLAGAASFSIEDSLSSDQITEETSVFIDGASVGTFKLSAGNPGSVLRVTVPDAPSYDYVLCGQTTVRMPDGGEETRPVNDSGTLSDPDGRLYMAFTEGYVTFFLVDVSAGKPKAEIKTHLGPRCPAPVANGAHAPIG